MTETHEAQVRVTGVSLVQLPDTQFRMRLR